MHLLMVGVLALFGLGITAANAQETGSIKAKLDGVWSGSGMVTLSSGSVEKATCRVTYKKYSEKSYKLLGRCSTASMGVVEQTAVVQEAGSNKYTGRFDNKEYNITGRISVALKGSKKQTATLTTDKGKGVLTLSKR